MDNGYPYDVHPCWANERRHVWERIHLPVAPLCNVKCSFCDHQIGASCHLPKPGSAARVMSPSEAIMRVRMELERRPNLHIAAISGPGEPLANQQTFETLRGIRAFNQDIEFCLSTNGILLSNYVDELLSLDVNTISVSISAVNPATAAKLYEWALYDGRKIYGDEMIQWILQKQIAGIQLASKKGIILKANSIMIPGINDIEIESLAQTLTDLGIKMQNITPLVPYANMQKIRVPTSSEIQSARKLASTHIRQFRNNAG